MAICPASWPFERLILAILMHAFSLNFHPFACPSNLSYNYDKHACHLRHQNFEGRELCYPPKARLDTTTLYSPVNKNKDDSTNPIFFT